MAILIPVWFFEFSFLMHFLATVVGLFLSYFSFKLYKYTRKRSHLFLSLAFMFITVGFAIVAISNVESQFHLEQCETGCVLQHISSAYDWIILGNYSYYATSLVGYIFFILSYLETGKKKKKLITFLQMGSIPFLLPPPQNFILFPFETAFFQPFHAISSILLLVIVFQTFSVYRKTKLKLSLLVSFAFVAILLYHVLMFAIPFAPLFFALAHLSLLFGFILLLIMLVKVNR